MDSTTKKRIRLGEYERPIVDFVISQREKINFKIQGHGVLKMNKVGTIYLDLVCTICEGFERKYRDSYFPQFENGSINSLEMRGTLLGGQKIRASDFGFETGMFWEHTHNLLCIFLDKITIERVDSSPLIKSPSLYLEVPHKLSIPKNKRNDYSLANGTKGSIWNEAKFHCNKAEVNIVMNEKYSAITIKGEFSQDRIIDSLFMYIGLTCGLYFQPFYSFYGDENHSYYVIYSINKKINSIRSVQSIPEVVSGGRSSNNEENYSLLSIIYNLMTEEPDAFETIYLHWQRFHETHNADILTQLIVITTAIEALINIIYKPKLASKVIKHDLGFDNKKKDIIKQLSTLDIAEEHLDILQGNVNNWGEKFTVKSGLNFFVKHEFIRKKQMKSWEKLRNTVVHLNNKRSHKWDEQQFLKDHTLMVDCYDIFFTLILDSLGYEGQRRFFSEDNVVKPNVRLEIEELLPICKL
jgi:hypothetical protein